MSCRSFCDIWASVCGGYAAPAGWKDKILSVIWNYLLRWWDMGFLLEWSGFSTQKRQSSSLLTVPKGLYLASSTLEPWPQDSSVRCLKLDKPTHLLLALHRPHRHTSLGAVSYLGIYRFMTLCQRHWNCTYMLVMLQDFNPPVATAFHFLRVFAQTHIQATLLLALHTMCLNATQPGVLCQTLSVPHQYPNTL